MTTLLQKAFDAATRLSPEEQDAIAAIILEELADEQRWQDAFANSQGQLARLSKEAIAEHRAGRTQELDPDKL